MNIRCSIKGYNILMGFFISLYIISVFIFSYNVETSEISKIFAIPVYFLSLIYFLFYIKKCKIDVFDISMGVFIILGLISAFYALNPIDAISMALTLVQLFILYFLIKFYVREEGNVPLILNSIAYGSALLGIYLLYFYGGIGGISDLLVSKTRVGNEIANVNALGILLSYGAVIFFWKAYYYNNRYNYIFSIFCSVLALGTASKKVVIVLILSTILFYYFKDRGLKKLRTIIYLFIVLFVVIYIVMQLPYFDEIILRVQRALDILSAANVTDESTELRYLMLKYGIESFCQNPLLGIGMANAHYIVLDKLFMDMYTHNNYIELLVNMGIIGTVCYYFIYYYIMKKLYGLVKKRDKIAILLEILLIVELFMQVGLVDYYNKIPYLLLICGYAYISQGYGGKRLSGNKG